MRDTDVPTKTMAGRAVISVRKLHLNPRQRTVLIAINGHQSMQEIRTQFSVLGDVDAIVGELSASGLLEVVGIGVAASATRVTAPLAASPGHSFMFTLKLERCYSKEELLGLLPEYQRVLGKAKEQAYADAMSRHAREMLDAV